MLHPIAASYMPTMPGVFKSLTAKAAAATAAPTTPTTPTATTAASDVGTTFLSLLVKELQNQDPTAPMDSTAMVGQMISLNQLAQLTSINQAVGGSTTALTGAVQPVSTTPYTAPANAAATPAIAPANQLPFDLNTMMPLPTAANAQALAASIQSSLN